MGDERGSNQILKQKMSSKNQDLILSKESTPMKDGTIETTTVPV
jgi:hypothetical protein